MVEFDSNQTIVSAEKTEDEALQEAADHVKSELDESTAYLNETKNSYDAQLQKNKQKLP